MPWYPRVHAQSSACSLSCWPLRRPIVALLVSALLATRSSCLSELARAYPRALLSTSGVCWRLPRHVLRRHARQQADEPWYLATNQPNAQQAVAWYRQRFWIEESFKDNKSRFHLKQVRIGSPERLTRLLLALTIALCWLALAALPESGALPPGWHAAVRGAAPATLASPLLCSTPTTTSRCPG